MPQQSGALKRPAASQERQPLRKRPAGAPVAVVSASPDSSEDVLADTSRANPVVVEALAAEGLVSSPFDSRRQNYHWVMPWCGIPGAVQPDSMDAEGMWNHLVRCYQEAYPDSDEPTKSILIFGLSAKEQHKNAPKAEHQKPHFHVATFSKVNHRWKKIRDISASKYKIYLHCAAHDGYSAMYRYLTCPSAGKKVYELDPKPFRSPAHPEGDALRQLLEYGDRCRKARSARHENLVATRPVQLRSTFATVFSWVIDKGLHGSTGALQLQIDACQELAEGRTKLMDFIKAHRNDLEDQLKFMWDIREAPQRMARAKTPRSELLLAAAMESTSAEDFPNHCANKDGRCSETYNSILTYQSIRYEEFCHILFEAVTAGRSKGNAVMLVGGKDCGKTTLTEPLRMIYKVMPTPQADSFCPLENIRGHEVLLWQDFRYAPGHPRKEEQGLRIDEGTWNRLLEGLPTLIGVPKTDGGRHDFVFDEDVGFVFTGPFPVIAWRNGMQDQCETEQITTRLRYINLARPAPPRRGRPLKHCPLCWSRWLLRGEIAWQRSSGNELDDFLKRASESLGSPPSLCNTMPVECVEATNSDTPRGDSFFAQLQSLMHWRQSGLLNSPEFKNAKRRLGIH